MRKDFIDFVGSMTLQVDLPGFKLEDENNDWTTAFALLMKEVKKNLGEQIYD